jgi:acyl-coenzyme A thioesterase PaaI-like protein
MSAARHPGDLERHVIRELGFGLRHVGDEMHGYAEIVEEMFVPGTTAVRASILATWIDITAGYLAVDAVSPRVPVTLDLDLHLNRQPDGCRAIRTVGRALKVGRSILVLRVDVTDDEGETIGLGHASFTAAPNPSLVMPPMERGEDRMPYQPPTLQRPFAERAGCERRGPGVAVQPKTAEGVNASNTLNGGLIALAVEEAALSVTPGATLSSLAMRYLQPVRVGPAVATADVHGGLGHVEVRDAGNEDRLAVIATTRAFPADT